MDAQKIAAQIDEKISGCEPVNDNIAFGARLFAALVVDGAIENTRTSAFSRDGHRTPLRTYKGRASAVLDPNLPDWSYALLPEPRLLAGSRN